MRAYIIRDNLWHGVEWVALRLLAAASRRLIAQRQSRRVHSEAWRRGSLVLPPCVGRPPSK